MKKTFRYFLLLVSLLVFASTICVIAYAKSHSQRINEIELWNTVNIWRQKEGLPMFSYSLSLCGFAEVRSREIQTNWSHNGFQKHRGEMESELKYRIFGENLSKESNYPDEILSMWLNSASHSANLHKDYNSSCIKCNGSYCVQLFGKK